MSHNPPDLPEGFDDEVADWSEYVADLDVRARHFPLTTWRAWERPARRMDQMRLLQMLALTTRGAAWGGNRCLGAETPVLLADGTTIAIGDIRGPVRVVAWDGARFVAADAEPHPRKGPEMLYRVTLSDGSTFRATAGHRVMDASGEWRPLSRLQPGFALARPPSSWEPGPSARTEDVPSSSLTTPGCRCCCPSCLRSDGAPPRPASEVGRDAPPSPDDAPARSRPDASGVASARTDGQPSKPSCNRPYRDVGPATDAFFSASDHLFVTSIVPDLIDYHYDLWVPSHANYVAGGAVQHNSGKTELAARLFVSRLLGSDHPDVIEWARINHVDISGWAPGPGVGWAVAVTSNASLQYHREMFDRLIAGYPHRWYKRESQGEARIYIYLPGGRAEIWLKSQDQGREQFQGAKLRAAFVDEEIKERGILAEIEARLVDEAGALILAMAPGVGGVTWVKGEIEDTLDKNKQQKWTFERLDSTHNPHLPPGEAERMGGSDPTEQAIRQRGEWVARAGRVYPQFSRHLHVFRESDRTTPKGQVIPPLAGLVRTRGLDWGTTHPVGCVWTAFGPDNLVIVYRTYKQTKQSTPYHAEQIKRGDGWTEDEEGDLVSTTADDIERGWMDPKAPQVAGDLRSVHDLAFQLADHSPGSVLRGIARVCELLEEQGDGFPRLVISETCGDLIQEFEGYVWKDEPESGKEPEPVKKNDHLLDALRYDIVGATDSHFFEE